MNNVYHAEVFFQSDPEFQILRDAQKQHAKDNLKDFQAIIWTAKEIFPILDTHYEHLRTLSPITLYHLLREPTFQYWIDVSRELISRNTYFTMRNGHPLLHFQDLSRFVLAAFVMEKKPLELRLRLDSNGRLFIPSVPWFFDFQISCGCDEVLITFDGSCIQAQTSSVSSKIPLTTERQMPDDYIKPINLLAGCYYLNSDDVSLQLPGRVAYSFQKMDRSSLELWNNFITECQVLLERLDPILLQEIKSTIKTIVPVISKQPDKHLSSSFSEMIGAIYMSMSPNPLVMLEALVHEFHHNKLYLFQTLDPIVNKTWRHEIYYSPWREDPRPINGLLHGAYSFFGIAQLWSQALRNDHLWTSEQIDFVLQRFEKAKRQVQLAINTIRKIGRLTAFGIEFLNELDRRVHMLENLRNKQYDTGLLTSSVQKELEDHRQRWSQKYGKAPEVTRGRLLEGIDTIGSTSATAYNVHPLGFQIIDEVLSNWDWLAPDDIQHGNGIQHQLVLLKEEDTQTYESLKRAVLDTQKECIDISLSFLRGEIEYVEGHFEEALRNYAMVISNRPNWLFLWHRVAFCLRHLGHIELSNSILLDESSMYALASRLLPLIQAGNLDLIENSIAESRT